MSVAHHLIFVALFMSLAGCLGGKSLFPGSRGSADYHATETTAEGTRDVRVKIRQPSNSIAPAGLTANGVGFALTTGAEQEHDQALGLLSPLIWIGSAMVVGGILVLFLRANLPLLAVLPHGISWGLILGGVGLIVLPMMLDRYGLWIAIGLGVAAAFAVGMRNNWFMAKANGAAPPPSGPPANG